MYKCPMLLKTFCFGFSLNEPKRYSEILLKRKNLMNLDRLEDSTLEYDHERIQQKSEGRHKKSKQPLRGEIVIGALRQHK